MSASILTLLLLLVLLVLLAIDWRQTITIVRTNRKETNVILNRLWAKFSDKKEEVTHMYFLVCSLVWPVVFMVFWPSAHFYLAVGVALCIPRQAYCVFNNFRLKIQPAGFP
jgi:hypothetical protein